MGSFSSFPSMFLRKLENGKLPLQETVSIWHDMSFNLAILVSMCTNFEGALTTA